MRGRLLALVVICCLALAACAARGPIADAAAGEKVEVAGQVEPEVAGQVEPEPAPRVTRNETASAAPLGLEAARTATSMIGVPYRYAGSSPHGFDCSGLVTYSYSTAGLSGLPHSARALERRVQPVSLGQLEPGDLLFFDLEDKAHVAIYVGERNFVHAPSPGGHVERVSFDHVYWGPRIASAGRIAY